MKVLLVNGSPRKEGSTYTALKEIADTLAAEGIETEIFHVGKAPIASCTDCKGCSNPDVKGCVINNDAVNVVVEKAASADGFIFGTPVHYAAASGAITALLGRCFYSSGQNFRFKPGSCIAVCRRGGSTAALEQLNKFLTISNMPLVSSQYWNMVHGCSPEQVKEDKEGMQTMRALGRNMAWLLKCIEAGKAQGIKIPEQEERIMTNFVR